MRALDEFPAAGADATPVNEYCPGPNVPDWLPPAEVCELKLKGSLAGPAGLSRTKATPFPPPDTDAVIE
jgi:hypothetical protein